MSALPSSWELCRFGDIARIRNGYAFKSTWFKEKREVSTDVPLIRQSQLKGAVADLSEAVFLDASHLKEFYDYRIQHGDVLIGMSGSIGKVCVYQDEQLALQNQRTGKIEVHPGADLEPKFLGLYLSSIERTLVQFAKGMGVQNISSKDIEGLPFSLPPLAEQRRIVGKVEELFSELDAGVANLKQARTQLAVYRQALLKHAFEGHLTADWRSLHQPVATVKSSVPHPIESWRFTTLADLTEYITSGSRGWAEFYADAGPIFIRAANLNRDRLDLSDVAFVSLPKGVEGTRTRTRLGDVFITITGANVTKAGFLDHEIGEAYVSQHVALCRPTDPTISEYLYLYIISNAGGRRDLEKAAYGAGKPGLNLDNLRTLQIPMPTRAEIPLIVEAIRSQLSAIDTLEADIDLNLQKAEALRQSILKKAFAGELVPQDPADEPAAALLARIRAEREAQPVNRRTRR